MCIADRSLSRLRGSPLPGTGCLGPKFCVRCIYPAHRDCLGPLSRVGAFILPDAAAAASPPVRVWVAVPLGLGWVLGRHLALVRLPCRVLLRRLCRRCAFGWAVPLGFGVGTRPVSRAGAFILPCFAAAALAAGALWGWLCRLGLGWALVRADVLRIRWTLMSPFPLTNNRPLSEGAAGASRLGEP